MTDVPGSGLRLNYDIYANVIYGYVGTRAGFDSGTLHSIDHLPANPITGRQDKSDSLEAQIGIDLAKSYSPDQLTTKILNNYIMQSILGPSSATYAHDRKVLPVK